MSKARLVITAIEVGGRTPAEVRAAYGVSRSWVYELLARYRAEGDTALQPPRGPRQRRRHRRTAPRAHRRPQPRLSAHRPTTRTRPGMTDARTPDPCVRASAMSCDITTVGAAGIEPATARL